MEMHGPEPGKVLRHQGLEIPYENIFGQRRGSTNGDPEVLRDIMLFVKLAHVLHHSIGPLLKLPRTVRTVFDGTHRGLAF